MIYAYTKFDHLFFNVRPNVISGIKIYGRDDTYPIEQDYNAITGEEQDIWQRLFRRLIDALDQYAPKIYLQGVEAMGLSMDLWPNFAELSPKVKAASGWELVSVAGFLDEFLFFELSAERKFPITNIVRQSKHFEAKYEGVTISNRNEYTPEPDIFHDIRGHASYLMNRDYGDFLFDVGEVGYELVCNERGFDLQLVAHNVKHLQNFAWWTYEFGIMKKQSSSDSVRQSPNDIDHEVYGSGILSSYDELRNEAACSKKRSNASEMLPFDMEEVVITRFDYSEIQDRYYVIESFSSLHDAFRENRDLFFYEG